ncbi:hypothetical protein CHS0354_000856 [Potamilus streckersoni]|uniref:DNA-directed DNA polymerase n=1 Tax=Potamilus streckersoni TaxID=2493646 RepID=A0AAE0RUW5_9BIVA|nr:hypothetical protein CHS0354_000856 [Potamilus streckersoni]
MFTCYEVLELLGDRVMYFDTDNCIYIDRLGQMYPAIKGDRLRAWREEQLNDKILSFASDGLTSQDCTFSHTQNRQSTLEKVIKYCSRSEFDFSISSVYRTDTLV